MEVENALNVHGGAARARQLLAVGCSSFDIAKAVRLGRVVRIARGAYALPNAQPDALIAATLCAGLTCVSVLARLELPLQRPPSRPHLAVARNFNAHAHGPIDARIHYQRTRPEPGQLASVAAALDCAGACLDEVWHLAAVDAALNRGLIGTGDIMRFRRSASARRDFLLRFADARAEAPGETIARLQLVRAGHAVRPQAYVEGAGRVDIEVDGLLILQVDGYGPHSERSAFRRDREKSRAVIKAGRPQLSYAASELLGSAPLNVVHDVRAALAVWNERDASRVRPAGERLVTVRRA